MKKTTRIISALLTIVFSLGLFSTAAFAANDRDPLYSDLKNYDEQRQYAVEHCSQPEVKQWVLDNLGREVGGCQYTPMAFASDVFGVSMPFFTDELTYAFWDKWDSTKMYAEYWRFIPNSEGLRFQAGDILLFPRPDGGDGHTAIVVGEIASYYREHWGTDLDNFVVVESNRGFPYVMLQENGYGLSLIGILRPDFSQTLAKRGSQPTEAPNINTASTWARDGINSAVAKGFVPVDIQDKYTNTITRAEFCRMAVKWLEYKTGKSIDTILSEKGLTRNTNAFSDTQDPDILAAYALGITSGTKAPTATTPGTFTPAGGFDRQQAAVMLRNTCKSAGMDVSNTASAGFQDIDKAATWAVDGINWVRNAGVMQGTSTIPLLYSPKSTYTREQSIITFNNIK